MKIVVKFLIAMLSTRAVRDLLIHCAEVLAARTDNRFDDEAVAIVKRLANQLYDEG